MTSLENDLILGQFFDTPEKKARWIKRLKVFYILWISFLIIGIISYLI